MTPVELESRVLAMEAEIADLKKRLERAELDRVVARGEADFANGKGIPARQAIDMLRRKHNIPTT
ncbi:MAG TPA: hypothetical protein VHM90_18855 [Phycisphaerae bacterium]|nr:hypothetical protein [Phycisphaerae bacterium]